MNIKEKFFCVFCRLTPFEEMALQLDDIPEEEKETSADWIAEAFLSADSAVSREDIGTFQEWRINGRHPDAFPAEVDHPIFP